jgi:hypothetical protein
MRRCKRRFAEWLENDRMVRNQGRTVLLPMHGMLRRWAKNFQQARTVRLSKYCLISNRVRFQTQEEHGMEIEWKTIDDNG